MPPRASKRLKATAEKAVTATVATTEVKTTRKTTKKTVVQETTVVVEKKTKQTSSETKSAWGALFAKPAAKRGENKGIKPKSVDGISEEVQKKIEEFAKFDGVTKERSPETKWKLVAWNVNGLRAVLKKEDSIHFRAYVAQEDPDVFCLSETKIDSDELQKLEDMLPQYKHQYWSCAAKKGYAGTVIFSKVEPLSVKDEILVDGKTADDEGRFIAVEFDTFWLVHTYVPNAGMKLDRLSFRTEQWDKALLKMLKELEETKPVVWCGDLNVAHQEIDIHDPKGNRNKSPGFTDAERESFSEILANGFVDVYRQLNPETQQYTYWSYRFNARAKNKGWRLDYFVISQSLLSSVESTFVRDAVTGSDHVPIGLELKAL
ncbi:hypothetical protein Poli38472_006961 [Pythium oligandrum]|uniref:DNA-(apurinic or apyrimidinic site) endonuclease n=1 Tax=Pythium oligandrum TaxID=41045 RepID=A0A8K1FDX0_PYTOL|nr:hypothetical protein Poli38472_006961 [Pythium oligandrum]|eukprot:TMW58816.1 hypothetical protein Poli38472_006961 [Pythium oligandrum]